MKNVIESRQITLGCHAVLCDATFAGELTEDLFNPRELERSGLLEGKAQGRGDAWFISFQDHEWVLRHFRRGGLVGKFIADRYLGWSLEKTRAWAEWRLLADLYQRGLPVPRPIAAAVTRGLGFYRADLLTELLPDSRSLADLLSQQQMSGSDWKRLGACLREFHVQGVYHADLNARNILINDEMKFFLIDFDRGALREPGPWREENLQRLKRSLLKIGSTAEEFHFSEQDWTDLLTGYKDKSF